MVGAQPVVEVPGYREAVARENLIRVTACLNLTETICGFEVKALTPYHLRFLSLVNSPFLIEGMTAEELINKPGINDNIIGFLWVVSPFYQTGCRSRIESLKGRMKNIFWRIESRLGTRQRNWLLNRLVGPKTNRDKFNDIYSPLVIQDAVKVCKVILDYVDDAFIDHEPSGIGGKSYFCQEMVFAYELHKIFPQAFRIDFWNDEPRSSNPSHVPLKLIFQLRKAHRAASDAEAVLSNKSEKVLVDGQNPHQRN